MRQIKVKDFGPIKEGFQENEGWMDIKKVTVFIGNQGTGKSTVAKLISTLTWLEKASHKSDPIDLEYTYRDSSQFRETCAYHRLRDYFQPQSRIAYRGAIRSLVYDNPYEYSMESGEAFPHHYRMPKIMYVPAERNFLSVVERPESVKGLPQPLYTFLAEYNRSLQELADTIPLPIGNLKFQYQKQTKTPYILGQDYTIDLLDASSGLQAAIPLFLVSRNLALSIDREKDSSRMELSVEEEQRMKSEIEKILSNPNLTDELKRAALEFLSSKYRNGCFINIVEEIEQNLFPQSQKDLLYKLLEFANLTDGNELILTTHSPYIINYLTLAVKAHAVLQKIESSDRANELKARLEEIVPIAACIPGEDLVIYELSDNGTIHRLPTYKGIPSDENYLNRSLDEANRLFDRLLEIETSI